MTSCRLLRLFQKSAGTSGGYIHLGATSNDITDTTTALQLKDAISNIQKKLDKLEEVLQRLSLDEINTVMIGRTHGQHAIPTTLGFKFAVWLREDRTTYRET